MLANFIKCEVFDASETGQVQHSPKIQKRNIQCKTKTIHLFQSFLVHLGT